MTEYALARIGSTDHYTTDVDSGGVIVYTARTLCGRSLAGTPVSLTSSGPCSTCQALLPCDECDHAGTEHLWAPALEATSPEAAAYVYEEATCWAENICRLCNPMRYAMAQALLPQAVLA